MKAILLKLYFIKKFDNYKKYKLELFSTESAICDSKPDRDFHNGEHWHSLAYISILWLKWM